MVDRDVRRVSDGPRGRVLHAGPAIVDVSMRVPAVPVAGGDVYAHDSRITAGGGANVMAAAARQGAQVVYLGARGDGVFSRIVDQALLDEGIALPSQVMAGVDVGYCIALVDDAGERTFVSVLGAEGLDNSACLDAVDASDDDVVYVTGYSMLNEGSRGAMMDWIGRLPPGARLVVDPSPLIGLIPDDALDLLRHAAWLWSLSESEARDLRQRVDPHPGADADIAWLTHWADGAVVLRRGPRGCQVAARDVRCGADIPAPTERVVDIPAPTVRVVDTTGAGDTHVGVLMAHLAAGGDLVEGARRATIAAALSVERRGPATAPTRAEVDAAVAAALG